QYDVAPRDLHSFPTRRSSDLKSVANYQVKPYQTFPTQDYARKAVRMERRLELALEGHRYFDLVRWGIAKTVLESYSAFEGTHLPDRKSTRLNSSHVKISYAVF